MGKYTEVGLNLRVSIVLGDSPQPPPPAPKIYTEWPFSKKTCFASSALFQMPLIAHLNRQQERIGTTWPQSAVNA